MDPATAATIQYVFGGLVTVAVAWIGYLTVVGRIQGTDLQRQIVELRTQVSFLRKETEECEQDRKIDQAVLMEVWPSDERDLEALYEMLDKAKKTLRALGTPLTIRDVSNAVKRLRDAKNTPKIGGSTDVTGYY